MNISVSAEAEDQQTVIEQTDIELVPDMTVYDALYQAADQQGVDLNVSVDDQSFITIDNINQTDLSEDDEWVYSVNEDPSQRPAIQL